MATPIKPTPVLTGKDARRFEKMLKENETKRISAAELERIIAAGRNVKVFDSMAEYEQYRVGAA